ncbi:MAG: ribosome biogenesis GTP-binding protein YihA/YsxC [Bacteroidia bacterium]
MEIKQAIYHSSHNLLKTLPLEGLPEFAFVGRSNVGKSSLINMLCKKKDMAKTSSTPGKTQCVNLFHINNQWFLTDLPGFGYAKVSQKRRAEFSDLVVRYVTVREALRHVFLLVDSRIPAQKIDLEFVEFLIHENKPFSLIFTKIEKTKNSQRAETLNAYKHLIKSLDAEMPAVIMTSAVAQRGREDILTKIEEILAEKEETAK